ncbi:MAG: cupredoxin domain-containing protein [Nanoarchaeota archaeon]|nr:cupredoxin domain-containing protein [Nanoarchaeota archaeon]
MGKTPIASIIIAALIALFIVYLIMVYPEERVRIFNEPEKYGGTNTILIEDEGFTPEEITINAGDKIVWVNKCETRQRVVGADFKSPILLPNERYEHVFDESGVYIYSSEFNPEMTGKVIVR